MCSLSLPPLAPQALTVYLGSVLYRMGDFCVLCVSTYVINCSSAPPVADRSVCARSTLVTI